MQKPGNLTSVGSSGGMLVLALVLVGAAAPSPLAAQGGVTFTKDIVPILQRSCQTCHRPDSVAPMSLITYEQVRPYARAIRQQTSLRQMPPWYIEKGVGIQKFRNDPSLSDREIATIGKWVDAGAPMGSPADMPAPVAFVDAATWSIGKPDLIISSPSITMDPTAPDWWGQIGDTPTGLTEDRYVAAVETKEINDMPKGKDAPKTAGGGLFVFHHSAYSVLDANGNVDPTSGFPAHEVGRNADTFDPEAGRLLKAGSSIAFNNNHLHANGRRTKARLVLGLKLHPVGYKPKVNFRSQFFGALEIDLKGNEANQQMDAYYTLPSAAKIMNFEPHMHAAGVRMCLEAIWGTTVQTLNCTAYNHNWVRNYQYEEDSTPLLPKGTILHIAGWADTTAKNQNVVDPRNWSGWGNRTVDNMFSDLAQMVFLTDEEFKQEVEKRREKIQQGVGESIGCLLCGDARPTTATAGRPVAELK